MAAEERAAAGVTGHGPCGLVRSRDRGHETAFPQVEFFERLVKALDGPHTELRTGAADESIGPGMRAIFNSKCWARSRARRWNLDNRLQIMMWRRDPSDGRSPAWPFGMTPVGPLTRSEGKRDRPIPTDEQIRTRAHQLWELAGSPAGRDDEFWLKPSAN